MRIILFVVVPVLALSLQAQSASNVLQLEPFKVTGSREHASDEGNPNPIDRFSADDVENSGVFNLGEFFAQLPPSPNGREQLVLIDGHPTYLNPADLLPFMIESVEVSRYGAMPQHGAFARGNVINIRLKKDYSGYELGLNHRGAFEGGGQVDGGTLAGGLVRGKLHALYSVSVSRTDELRASERVFSAEQDHTARGGHDLRLLWGAAAVVQAVSGPLTGVTDASGRPVPVALMPEGVAGISTPSDFIPGRDLDGTDLVTAIGQRRFNTAPYLYLVSPSTIRSFNFNLIYAVSERLNVNLSGSFGRSDSRSSAAPPVSPVSTAALVPAALNPFGQDVEVGLVHPGFGAVVSRGHGQNFALGLNLSGAAFDRWHWGVNLGLRRSVENVSARDLDRDKFAASLLTVDPAQRFNPFGNPGDNAALYPALSVQRTSETGDLNSLLDASIHGPILQAPGGPAMLNVRASLSADDNERSYAHAIGLADATIRDHSTSYGVSTNLDVPFVGPANVRPGLNRLTVELSSSFKAGTDSSRDFEQRVGLAWSPTKPLAFRASAVYGFLGPVHYVARVQPLLSHTLVDPRRFPATAEGVQIVSRDFEGTRSAHTDQEMIGVTLEPPGVQGLEISLTYDRQHRGNVSGTPFNAQDLVDNESALTGRVIRAAPTAGDLLLGQPGAITAVDITPVDGGELESSGANLSVVYRIQSKHYGGISFFTTIRHGLTSKYEFSPGRPFTSTSNSSFSPPDWTVQGQLSWNARGWNVATQVRYSDAITGGTITVPSLTDVSINLSYRFPKAIVGHWGKGLHVGVGLGGLLEGPPPFADTIEGFRGGSALGRTYSCRLTVPL